MLRPKLVPFLVLALLATPLLAQKQQAPPLLNGDEAHRAERIALTGTLGLPALLPLTVNSPRNSIYFADRLPLVPPASAQSGSPPMMFDGFLPSGASGTGSTFPEVFKYQLGNGYDVNGPAHPLVVAYHGFGMSAASVANQSQIDEECNLRNWVYVAPTGLDDQLFGSPISQQHVSAVIQWMITNHNVDPDRIYMVGFSMGGGVVGNYAARHRDPEGIMIAAVGSVSATMDWTMEYTIGNSSVKTLMQNIYNFGGTPTTQPFKYQQVSGLHFTPGTYPPLPGTLNNALSMATNLGSVPAYVTYDTGDTITHIPALNESLASLLTTNGTTLQKVVTSGTLGGDGNPAPHSWAVLDEADLFDFFDGKVVQRVPADFAAQLDLGGPVSWVDGVQKTAGAFSYLDGDADLLNGHLTVSNASNLQSLAIDAGAAGISSMPARVTVSTGATTRLTLSLTGFPQSPSYLLDANSGALITLVDSDPATGSLICEVAPGSTLDVDVIHDPNWSSSFTSSPNPVLIGNTTQVDLNGPTGALGAWLIVSFQEQLLTVKGVKITALPVPPALILFVPVDGFGDLSFPADVPNDPILQGLRLPTQGILTGSGGLLLSVTNLWGFSID